MDELQQLADLIRHRNDISARITKLIGRPAQIGHIGEWIASKVFDIELEVSATSKGIDGRFNSGPLRGKSVNVKFYAKQEGLLAINESALPDFYLVMAGPRSKVMTSRGEKRPWCIDLVYLFSAQVLVHQLVRQGCVKIDQCATSIRQSMWAQAEIYPSPTNTIISLDVTQSKLLALFHSRALSIGCSDAFIRQ